MSIRNDQRISSANPIDKVSAESIINVMELLPTTKPRWDFIRRAFYIKVWMGLPHAVKRFFRLKISDLESIYQYPALQDDKHLSQAIKLNQIESDNTARDPKISVVSSNKSLKRWGFAGRAFYRFIETVLPKLFQKAFRVQIIGQDILHKFPEGTPVIFCGNHRSNLDGIILGIAMAKSNKGSRRYLAFMGNGKALQENLLFRQMKRLGAFPVFRDTPESGLNYAIETLKANMAVAIFPQGGRVSRTPLADYQNLHQGGQTGVGRIILRMNGQIPVIPFYIHGSAEALGVGQKFPRWGAYLSIRFGKPMYFNQHSKSNGWIQNQVFFKTSRTIADQIMGSIWDLLKEVEIDYLEFLERKLHIDVSKATTKISDEEERKFNKLLTRLAKVSPKEIKRYLYARD